MKVGKGFTAFAKRARREDAYRSEKVIQSFVRDMLLSLDAGRVSRAELARRLGTSAAYVTKVLRGDVNFTVDTMVKLARATEMTLHLHLAPEHCDVRWFDLPQRPVETPESWESDDFRKVRERRTKEGEIEQPTIAA